MLWIQRSDDLPSETWELWCGPDAEPLVVTLPGRVGYQLERLFKSSAPDAEERTAALDVAPVEEPRVSVLRLSSADRTPHRSR